MEEFFELQVFCGLLGEFFFEFGEFNAKLVGCLF